MPPGSRRRWRRCAGGRVWEHLDTGDGAVVIDVDATLVEIHSENKEDAAPHFKGGYGFHPMIATCDTTGETLAVSLRAGVAGANSAADHLAIVDAAIAQLPEPVRRGHGDGDDPAVAARPVVVRADSAGAVKAFVCGLRRRNVGFSVNGPLQRPSRRSDTDHPVRRLAARPDPDRHRALGRFRSRDRRHT